MGVLAWGCSPRSDSMPPEDSFTAGRITIVSVPDSRALMERQAEAFTRFYPEGVIDVRAGHSRDAISAVFAASADLAVVARELEAEEQRAAVEAGLDLQGYRFARDALVLVAHPDNPVENLSRQDIAGIYRGDMTNWNAVGGPDAPIVSIVQPPASDLSLYLRETLLEGEGPSVRAITEEGDSAVVARVVRTPGAIGYVSLAGLDLGAKALRVAALTGLSYWRPDPEAVYKGDYPLTRFHNLFVRAGGARLAHGFVTFVTSGDGQRLVHEAGLVPTTVPVRFVRRSPMIGTHEH
jgi:phosphate transport system substrate-binding protein